MFSKLSLMSDLQSFLEKNYLDWQAESGRRRTLEEYANYLGVSRPLLTMWMNGKRNPGAENIRLLSARLGLEIYDIMGLERPDPDLSFIDRHWEELPDRLRKSLRDQAEKYIADNESERIHKQRTENADT